MRPGITGVLAMAVRGARAHDNETGRAARRRRLLPWAFVALATFAAGTPAEAQSGSDGWDVFVAPYLIGAAQKGKTTLRGVEADAELSTSDIFSNLQFGAMGLVVARKGGWGVGGDAIWMALGTTVRETNIDFNQGAFSFYGLRELGPLADVAFGLRVNTLQGELTFKRLDTAVSQDQTWVDPLVGLNLRTPGDRRLQLRAYTEIGGFGAGSDFTWQIFPTLSLKLTRMASLELGYRWLDIDYQSGEGNGKFAYDMLTQGPVVGFGLRF